MKKRIHIVIGTRPELIKMAPVMKALHKRRLPFYFIHSNQHYSPELDGDIITSLGLPAVNFHLHVGSGTHGAQTGKIMTELEMIWEKQPPSLVLVHGDTNTTLGAALAASKSQYPVAHVEAGLRSNDYKMPEEINRILTDRISNLHFVPSSVAKDNLLKEGFSKKSIHVTGNTIVDAVLQNRDSLRPENSIFTGKRLPEKYMLVTAHRPENVDTRKQLVKLLQLLTALSKKTALPIIWPLHPRTSKQITLFELQDMIKGFHILNAVNYLQMLELVQKASLVATDSGGLQEEAYILQKPLITLRDSTERPETLTANFIVGLSKTLAYDAWRKYSEDICKWGDELGSGNAAEIMADILESFIQQRKLHL